MTFWVRKTGLGSREMFTIHLRMNDNMKSCAEILKYLIYNYYLLEVPLLNTVLNPFPPIRNSLNKQKACTIA